MLFSHIRIYNSKNSLYDHKQIDNQQIHQRINQKALYISKLFCKAVKETQQQQNNTD